MKLYISDLIHFGNLYVFPTRFFHYPVMRRPVTPLSPRDRSWTELRTKTSTRLSTRDKNYKQERPPPGAEPRLNPRSARSRCSSRQEWKCCSSKESQRRGGIPILRYHGEMISFSVRYNRFPLKTSALGLRATTRPQRRFLLLGYNKHGKSERYALSRFLLTLSLWGLASRCGLRHYFFLLKG